MSAGQRVRRAVDQVADRERRGALLRGRVKGNKGGPRHGSAKLRVKSRAEYARVIDELEDRDLTQASIYELCHMAHDTGRYGGLLAKGVALDVVAVGTRVINNVNFF